MPQQKDAADTPQSDIPKFTGLSVCNPPLQAQKPTSEPAQSKAAVTSTP
jgi:hypothetical protein